MHRLRAALVAACCLFAAPRVAGAQANTAETLRDAVQLYEDLQVERAVALFRQVVSPSTPFEVSREQGLPVTRVTLWETPTSWATYAA